MEWIWRQFLARIELRYHVPECRIHYAAPGVHAVDGTIWLSWHVRERNTGAWYWQSSSVWPVPLYPQGRATEEWIFGLVLWCLEHELREAWHVDGIRTKDPHSGDPR